MYDYIYLCVCCTSFVVIVILCCMFCNLKRMMRTYRETLSLYHSEVMTGIDDVKAMYSGAYTVGSINATYGIHSARIDGEQNTDHEISRSSRYGKETSHLQDV